VERDITILLLRIGLAAVLYFFLFQLLLVLWRDLRPQTVAGPVVQATTGPALSVVDPVGSGRLAAEMISLQAINSLGRGPQNTIVLNDSSVSADHALVSYRLGQWWVEDVGSRNGTYLNDVRIDQPTVIHSGDVVRVGLVSLGVHV
jgi:pSer/pThr/pTyr-binding forkhead associated (FHA) protein